MIKYGLSCHAALNFFLEQCTFHQQIRHISTTPSSQKSKK